MTDRQAVYRAGAGGELSAVLVSGKAIAPGRGCPYLANGSRTSEACPTEDIRSALVRSTDSVTEPAAREQA